MKKTNITYAHEQNTLVVGKHYLVAHVTVTCAIMEKVIRTVPIIPILHSDPQFGNGGKHEHYHIDGRFTEIGFTNNIESETLNGHILSEIFYKKKKCKRIVSGLRYPEEHILWAKWQETMIGKSCKGKKCPHRGTNMIEVDGHLVCPMHNLVGCATKEVIIDKYIKPNGKIYDNPNTVIQPM